ncbi:MAG: cyclic nucleotide-binding domain-containing protein, partial [Inhella sp.]|nr:cyclic nucleotide-binding domain-containing protein [Inhella sp.]
MQDGFHEQLLQDLLVQAFGALDASSLALLREQLRWVEVAAGQTLMAQGEPGDALYLSVSGRLRAYVAGEDGTPRMVREMGRGQVIGELSLYTDAARSASVVAVRDSVLVRLDKAPFLELLEREPRAGVQLTRGIVARLQTQHLPTPYAAPVVQTLLPI